MTITTYKNGLLLQEVSDFDVGQTLECGQFFRYRKNSSGNYTIVAYGKVLHVEQKGRDVFLYPTSQEEFDSIWKDFFDLNKDYGRMKKRLAKDPVLKKAIEENPGIRILKQEPWECMTAFQISQNSNIPRIRQVIENIAGRYGEEIAPGLFTFPVASQMVLAGVEGLRQCKTGFRDQYLFDGAQKVAEGKLLLEELAALPTAELKNTLMTVKGIGPKVSDCILLFSYSRTEVFPTDVWIKRAVENLYFGGNKMAIGKIQEFAASQFGEDAGYAQQYLFHYYRKWNEKNGK